MLIWASEPSIEFMASAIAPAASRYQQRLIFGEQFGGRSGDRAHLRKFIAEGSQSKLPRD